MLDKILHVVGQLKTLFVQITEAGFALIGFIVLIYLLLGEASGAYVISVVSNILLLLGAITPEALVAIALILAIAYLARKRA